MAMVPFDEYFSARLCSRGDLGIISHIIGNLDAQNQKRFSESCFGQFLDLGEMQLQGQLYLHLLFKQDSSAQFTDELVFHINNNIAHFGPKEFALITGLHFGEKVSIPQESHIYKTVFKSKRIVTVKDIEVAFFKACRKGTKDLSFKLALLWVLFGILIPRGHASKKIERQYIHLVDDLIKFNTYPWGRVAFEFLVSEFRAVMGNRKCVNNARAQVKDSGWRCHIEVYGFGWALQVWAYEAMPCVAKLCATRKKKSRATTPRMLHWNANGIIRFDELTTYCFPILKKGDQSAEQMPVMEHLIASRAEVNTPAYQSVVKWLELSAPDPTQPSSCTRTRKRKMNDGASTSTGVGHGRSDMKKKGPRLDDEMEWRKHVMEQLEKLNNNQRKLHKLMVSIKASLQTGQDDVESAEDSGNDEVKVAGDRGECTRNKIIDKEQDDTEEEANSIGDEDDTEEETDNAEDEDDTEEEADNAGEESEYSGKNEIESQQERCTTLVLWNPDNRAPEPTDEMFMEDYDPCDHHVPKACIDKFGEWWKSNQQTGVVISLTVGVIPSVDAQWFNTIWNPDGWLNGENVDALMHLIMTKVKKCLPLEKRRKTTFVDLNFVAKLTSGIFDTWEKAHKKRNANWLWGEHAKAALAHVEGTLPNNGFGMPWSLADYVYGVANVNNAHWVLYEMQIMERTIVVYDSLYGPRPPARQATIFRRLAMVLPSICREGRVFDVRDPNVLDKKAWAVKRYGQTPKQSNYSDCGVMTIKMLECLVFGKSLHDIDPRMCAKYRKDYCAELFHKDNICAT